LNFSRSLAAVLAATSLLVPTASAQDASGTPSSSNAADASLVQAPDATPTEGATSVPLPVVAVLKVVDGTVTGYAAGGNGGIGGMTASGVRTHWGTVAADWHLYPVGTRLQIEGFPNDVFTVEDSGGNVHGNVFDVWFPDLPTAVAFGTRTLRVTVLAN
jgi:3D (Asp-Asp-Asp) domain-containing protein